MTERTEDCLSGRTIFTANWRDDSGAFGTERIIRGQADQLDTLGGLTIVLSSLALHNWGSLHQTLTAC